MIAKNLSILRKQLLLSQNDFALKLGISPRAYVNYERGERKPPYELLILLSDNFNVNLNWLIAGKGSIYNSEPSDAAGCDFEQKTAAVLKKYGLIN